MDHCNLLATLVPLDGTRVFYEGASVGGTGGRGIGVGHTVVGTRVDARS